MLQIQSPFQQLFDKNGSPLDDGYVYIGTANTNPETNPIAIYWDDAGTIPAAQPLRTLNGYIVRSGTPARVYTALEDFSMTVKDKQGRVVFSVLDATSLSNLQSSLASSSGSSLVGFLQAGTGAVTRTVQSKLRETVSVKDFGAIGDGVADDTDAVQAALATGKTVYVPGGTYNIAGLLTLNANQHIYGDGRGISKLYLAYNGDMIKAARYCGIKSLGLIGNGATYSGRGIYFTGTTPMAIIEDCSIKDFNGYCIEFVEGGTGSQCTVINCDIYQTNQNNPGIKLPNPESYGPARRFINIQCSGGILADVGASDNTMFIGCQANGLIFPPGVDNKTWAKKTIVNGCRFSTLEIPMTVYGEDHIFVGNAIAGPVILGLYTKNCKFVGNLLPPSFVISDQSSVSNPANTIDSAQPITQFATTWTGTITNPSVGDANVSATYSMASSRVTANITITIGSTTTLGSGTWVFTLPIQSSPVPGAYNIGTARLKCGGSYYCAAALNVPGTSSVQLYVNDSVNACGPTVPAAWGVGDSLELQIDYPIIIG